jgi:hypothetical protein
MKKIIGMAGVLFFLVSILFFVPCKSYAINPQPEPPGNKAKSSIAVNESYIGTIVKIDGKKITVRDGKGMERIVTGTIVGLKIGDKVKVTTRDGLTWLNPQPEPPSPQVKGQIKATSTPEAPGRPPKTSPKLK